MSACVLPMGHKGRCRDDLCSWESPGHTTCEECDRLGKALLHAQHRARVAEVELARLRAAVAALLAAAPAEAEQLRPGT